MDKSHHPTSFGVFKPVGHVVIAMASEAQCDALANSLVESGFASADLVHYTSQEMIGQVQADMLTASPLASLGQDLNLIKAHRTLAEQGSSFLVVHAPKPEQVERVTAMAKSFNAQSAQRYGTLIVEELITAPSVTPQAFESPDTGLDIPVVANARP